MMMGMMLRGAPRRFPEEDTVPRGRRMPARSGALRTGRAAMTALMAFVVLALIGAASARNEAWRDPVGLWERAVEGSPNSSWAHYNLAQALETADPGRAAVHYRTAIGLQPGYFAAMNNLGNVLLRLGDYEQAAEAFRGAIALRPSEPLPHDNLGYVFFMLGRMSEAAEEYRKALLLAPGRPESHNNLGYVYLRTGLAGRAAEEFETALALAPELTAVRENLDLARRLLAASERRK